MSMTQRLARISVHHPWQMLAGWAVILVVSFVAIAGLLGSALTTEANITTRPDSVVADELLSESFPDNQRVDEVVIIHSSDLTSTEPAFVDFVEGVRSSIADTGSVETVGNPYGENSQAATSPDGRAVAVTLLLDVNPEDGIASVLDAVDAADGESGFDVSIAGSYTLDYDFTELSESDLQKGELQFGLPAALIVLLLVFGAVVAALIPLSIAIGSIIVAVAISAVVGQAASLSFFIVNMITAMGLRSASTTACSYSPDIAKNGLEVWPKRKPSWRLVEPRARQCCSAAAPLCWRCSVCSWCQTPSFAAWDWAPSSWALSPWLRL